MTKTSPLFGKIHKTSDYKRLKPLAAKSYSQTLLLLYAKAEDGFSTRYGITITKSLGNAVTRNKIRRRLRVLLQQSMPTHGIAGYDHVVIARHAAQKAEFTTLQRDLLYILRKAKEALAHETSC